MIVLGTGQAGKVKRLKNPSQEGTIALCTVKGNGKINGAEAKLDYESTNCIIESVSFGAGVNAQFQHTVGNSVYMYVFGDKIGQVQISGLAFAESCDTNTSVRVGSTGLEKAFAFYKANNPIVSSEPITVLIGHELPLRGYFLDFSAGNTDPDTRTSRFTLTMNLLNTEPT